MSVHVHDCEPDIDIECDGCEESVKEYSPIFCAKCAGRDPNENTRKCHECKKEFGEKQMFSKIEGVYCHHCAFIYEAKLAGLILEGKVKKAKKS